MNEFYEHTHPTIRFEVKDKNERHIHIGDRIRYATKNGIKEGTVSEIKFIAKKDSIYGKETDNIIFRSYINIRKGRYFMATIYRYDRVEVIE